MLDPQSALKTQYVDGNPTGAGTPPKWSVYRYLPTVLYCTVSVVGTGISRTMVGSVYTDTAL